MDCEKFDRIVLDLLYDELDELTSAATRRHMEHCARCRAIGSGLRATREVGALPMVEPPEGLSLRILHAEEQATQLLPIGKRLGRGLSLLAGYAMRPQVSMAALLMHHSRKPLPSGVGPSIVITSFITVTPVMGSVMVAFGSSTAILFRPSPLGPMPA